MITAVDTNILLDIFLADKSFTEPSSRRLRQCIREGSLTACDIVWTETATGFSSSEKFIEAMKTLGVSFSRITGVDFHIWRNGLRLAAVSVPGRSREGGTPTRALNRLLN